MRFCKGVRSSFGGGDVSVHRCRGLDAMLAVLPGGTGARCATIGFQWVRLAAELTAHNTSGWRMSLCAPLKLDWMDLMTVLESSA